MNRTRLKFLFALLCLAVFLPAKAGAAAWQVLAWPEPYDYSGVPSTVAVEPLARAVRPWRICASYPHLKDAYWISVNYGMVEQALEAGVHLTVIDAGGYPSVDRQWAQIEMCSRSADAMIVSPSSYDGLTPLIQDIAKRIPVIAAVNDIDGRGISAKVGVPWREMGRSIGQFIAARVPTSGRSAPVAWFLGPHGAGWVPFVDAGFREGIAGSSAKIVAVDWGDTGFEIQLRLVEETLDRFPSIAYLVGSAVTADAAVSVLRARGLEGRVMIAATYFTHGTYRAIKRGKVIAAPTDAPVLQGRLAIDQAIRVIEGKLIYRHLGPPIRMVDKQTVDDLPLSDCLAPPTFVPRFEVP